MTDVTEQGTASPGTLRAILAALLGAAAGGLCVGMFAMTGLSVDGGLGAHPAVLLAFPVFGMLFGALPALVVAFAMAWSIRRNAGEPLRMAIWLVFGAAMGTSVFLVVDQLVSNVGGAAYNQAKAQLATQPGGIAYWLRRALPYAAAGMVGTLVIAAVLRRRPSSD
jgi:hypothetical protein